MTMELIGMPLSPFVKKCELVLREKGLEFTYRQISPLIEREAYLEYSPVGKMPILKDGDFALPDSSAICAYLDAIAPEPPLLPAEPKDRAWVLWLEEYSDSALLELCAGLFRCRFIGPRLMGLPVDEEGAQALLNDTLPPIFTYLEEQLANGREYLWHGGYSLADAAVASQLCMMVLAGGEVDPASWPKLAAWHERVRKRPAFQDCLAEEQRFFDVWQNSDQFKPADGAAAARQLRMDETDS
ncbi:glutathione S-transferase family protein [Qipengyuania sp. DSG2-2]|uniref:glutathione S-transferase family protein n=1 Tax=Qipengyuania sp. DGS2-2 TaxID=3349631 RepID=UPI0036D2CFBD